MPPPLPKFTPPPMPKYQPPAQKKAATLWNDEEDEDDDDGFLSNKKPQVQ